MHAEGDAPFASPPASALRLVELALKLVRTGTMGEVDAAAFAGVDPAALERELSQAGV